uniref:F-box domain-containing protein n=1 Tax=Leersia perrieri TaxID=77586 RepID=A0A0D9VE59_9ORYZ
MVGAPPTAEPKPSPKPSTTTISDLHEELLLEILLRLPSLPNLVRVAFTCRPWLRAIASSPEFRRRFRALHPQPLLGHFADAEDPPDADTPEFVTAAAAANADADLAAVLRGGDLSFESIAEVEGGEASPGWHVVDCHGGYLLLLNPFYRMFAITNPLIRNLDFFSPLPGEVELKRKGESAFTGFHLVHSDEDPGSFTVIFVCRDKLRLRAVVFSSENGNWIVHPWIEFAADSSVRLMSKTGVLVDGSIYWPCGCRDIMKLNIATMEFSNVELPRNLLLPGCTLIAGDTKDGALCIVCAVDFLFLVLLRRIGSDGIETWVLQNTFTLSPYLSWVAQGLQYSYKGIRVMGVKAGYVYLAKVEVIPNAHSPYSIFSHCFSLCLETMRLDRLPQERFEGRFYPYIMAWPPSLIRVDGSFGHEAKGSQ